MTTHFALVGCLSTTLCGLSTGRQASFQDSAERGGLWTCRTCLRETLRFLRGFCAIVLQPVMW
jgi:hypothetical protein